MLSVIYSASEFSPMLSDIMPSVVQLSVVAPSPQHYIVNRSKKEFYVTEQKEKFSDIRLP
jgi:hypothetical protein